MNIRKLVTVLMGVLLVITIGGPAYAVPLGFGPPGLEDKVPEGYLPPGLQKKTPAPFLGLTIAGVAYETGEVMVLPNGKLLFPKRKIKVGDKKNPDFEVELQMLGDIDPFMSYAFSAINYTDEAISFSTTGSIYMDPIVDGPNTVYASLGASVTDLGGDGVSITPAATATDTDHDGVSELQTAFVGNGTDWWSLGVDVGTDFSTSASISSYGPFEAGEQAGPIGNWTELSYSLDFVLSPLDSVAFTGYVSIEPNEAVTVSHTPIPGTLWLFGSGLVGMVTLRRRYLR